MKRLVLLALFCTLIMLASCSPIEQQCEKPFILKDGECCLDMDEDGSCDTEQNATKEETEQTETEIVVEETTPVEVETKKTETTEEPEEEPIEKITEDLTEEEIEEFEKESASVDASSLLEKLMKTYTNDVTGYKYLYHDDWYFLYEDNIKVKLGESEQYMSQDVNGTHYAIFYVDTIYMNLINKTAIGYCEGNDPRLGNRRCAELELEDVPYKLRYSDFYTKRPDEWLFEAYTLEPEVKTETGYYYVGPRKVRRLEYQDGPTQVIMYYDEEIGLPIKVQTFIDEQPSGLWLYDFLSANTIKEKHVRHRTAEEISSKEGFYSTAN
ncbi:hypothetical protein KY338_00705 [Candidatus Woesearchaeota archaeon]|nr:hypothetical protein [Candidatus Woesearchaeota archaeon]MBW3005160.1 hypothetical protein [Candidatus Woesearchaeota archaeon]